MGNAKPEGGNTKWEFPTSYFRFLTFFPPLSLPEG